HWNFYLFGIGGSHAANPCSLAGVDAVVAGAPGFSFDHSARPVSHYALSVIFFLPGARPVRENNATPANMAKEDGSNEKSRRGSIDGPGAESCSGPAARTCDTPIRRFVRCGERPPRAASARFPVSCFVDHPSTRSVAGGLRESPSKRFGGNAPLQ